MIPIKIVDVIRKETPVEGIPPIVHMQVILFDEVSRRALVMWVGEFEGYAILNAQFKEQTPRPMTLTFISRLLAAADAQLERVEINAIKDDVYFATAFLRMGDETRMVDARPSDAIGLALEMGAPLFIDERVLEKQGIAIPDEHLPNGGGIAAIKARFEQLKPAYDAWNENLKGKSEAEKSADLQRDLAQAVSTAFGKP